MRDPSDPAWPDAGERTTERDIAERWKWDYLALERGEHRRRILGGREKPVRLEEAVRRYLDHRQDTVEEGTWHADRTGLHHLLEAFPGKTHTEVTAEALGTWVQRMIRMGYRVPTVRSYTVSMRSFFAWLGEHNPAREVKLPAPGTQDVRVWSEEEVQRLRAAADTVDSQQVGTFPSARLMLEAGLAMGLRQSELFALRWEDVRASERVVRVDRQVVKSQKRTKPLKGKRSRTALILPSWWPWHQRRMGWVLPGRDGDVCGYRTQRNLITRVLDTAGLNEMGAGFHTLRHTYSADFLRTGGWLQELQRSLGHASIKVTQESYGHLQEDVAARLARERIYGE